MSRSSFPRPEHSALLRERITAALRAQELAVEVGGCRLDHFRCCYCFGFRRGQEENWMELPVHFQVVARMEAGGGDSELSRILETFLRRNFSRTPA